MVVVERILVYVLWAGCSPSHYNRPLLLNRHRLRGNGDGALVEVSFILFSTEFVLDRRRFHPLQLPRQSTFSLLMGILAKR